jgi:hypothetical protein
LPRKEKNRKRTGKEQEKKRTGKNKGKEGKETGCRDDVSFLKVFAERSLEQWNMKYK